MNVKKKKKESIKRKILKRVWGLDDNRKWTALIIVPNPNVHFVIVCVANFRTAETRRPDLLAGVKKRRVGDGSLYDKFMVK